MRRRPRRPLGSDPDALRAGGAGKHGAAALVLGAIGVVFGDIGTSPLYALQETFNGPHPMAENRGDIFGVVSIVFWSITVIVSIKYVLFIMRADNDGEGGIMALVSLLLRKSATSTSVRAGVVVLGLVGAALFYADGAITPAISVLSAVEGLNVLAPSLHSVVVPVTVTIIVALFLIQRFGTHIMGRVFGPVMIVWFIVIAALGLASAVREPAIFAALSPTYGAAFIASDPTRAFLALGSIVLTVTGAEALYADMGHFGRAPISRAWFWLVFPALVLNYLGQSALLLRSPSNIDNLFYHLAPSWGVAPLIVLATLATIIASQAVISGAFSVTRQSIQLGFMPRLQVRHTSSESIGQVYVPVVNWLLLGAVIGLVLAFPSSAQLASAYGIAVTGTLVINTILAAGVVVLVWKRRPMLAVALVGPLLILETLFLASNLTKVASGGWVPLLIGAVLAMILATWWSGRNRVFDMRSDEMVPLATYLEELRAQPRPPIRIPGTAVYLNA
ncbi:MAG: KUP/HAK/KT family potassium transporter, partial [Thermoleophilia bacterium]|nr:KUP/HAK/KT family potassium transporter [Thermoleophilia bacterium]